MKGEKIASKTTIENIYYIFFFRIAFPHVAKLWHIPTITHRGGRGGGLIHMIDRANIYILS
jgi:hypothetical protein